MEDSSLTSDVVHTVVESIQVIREQHTPFKWGVLSKALFDHVEVDVDKLQSSIVENKNKLTQLLAESAQDQIQLLYEVQKYCSAHSFVRVKLDNGQEMSLVKVLFKLLLQYGIIDVSDFVAWSEDECEDSLFASKSKVLIQTCDFLLVMQEIQNSISTTDDDEQNK